VDVLKVNVAMEVPASPAEAVMGNVDVFPLVPAETVVTV